MQGTPTTDSMYEAKTPLGKIWLLDHEILGFVVFDPTLQRHTDKNRVRLYIAADKRTGTFHVEALKGKFKSPPIATEPARIDQRDAALAEFNRMNSLLAFVARLKGHCEWCGHAYGHTNFTYCSKCEWINCSCGDAQCCCTPYKERKSRPRDFTVVDDWQEQPVDSEMQELYDELRREGMEYADMVYANKG